MFESKWGLRFVAFVLALAFFLTVNNVFGNIFGTSSISQNTTRTIQNVPVEATYNSKNLYASGIPESVDVQLKGSQSKVLKAEQSDDIKVELDLTNTTFGRHKIDYEIKGLDKDVEGTVNPKQATVNLERKVSKEMTVTADVSDKDIDPNYQVKNQSVTPKKVKVIGGQHQVEKIAYLKATFKNASNIKDDTTDVGEIVAFDKNLKRIDVITKPSNVNITVELKPYSKKVDIKKKVIGKANSKLNADNVNLSKQQVEIFGNREELSDIQSITGVINLADFESSDEAGVSLELPDTVKKADSSDITATVSAK
ncbi:YbbR-like domain-containing protein [Staphylococcus simulans]|uniref:CdaR family protein n=1 Tax=Staphylococcus simulans TaxID=1286 RepID=UPI000D02E8B0|nr:CdaR family protein [Staphylococcus simulans]MCD8916237.1 YbbR-like domain-containing protein [Staphylococcus simulans]